MDAESSNISKPRGESKVEYPQGTDNEVLRIKNSTLWLMAGNNNDNDKRTVGVVRKGDFSFRMIVRTQSPILITVCMINGDLQWPLTRDTPVLRVGSRSFAFAMPGLLYGLQFSCGCCEEALETLERVFMRFGHYEDHSAARRETGIQIFMPEADPCFWAASQLKIQKIVEPFLTQLGASSQSVTRFDHMNEQILRVMRMSAITKLITKGVLVGGIDPTEHIQLFGPSSLSSDDEDHDINSRASATIFVFSDIVEAVEAYGVIISGVYQSIPPYEPKWTPMPDITFWNISKSGLIRLLQVMVASTTTNFEVMGDSATKNEEEIITVVEPMEEDLKTVEEFEENTKMNELMEEIVMPTEEEVMVPIREIKFPIINEVGNIDELGEKNQMDDLREGNIGELVEKNRVEDLREACASMEVA